MKKYIIGLVVILIIIVPFVLNKKNGKAQYLSEPIQKRTITQIVEATGTIEPINTVSIGSQVSGRIDEIFVDYNSHVEKGQLLAQIDTSLFKAQLQQSEANINNAKATLQKNKALLDYDTKTYHRYKNLYERNLVSKNDLDEAESAYKSDLAQVAAAKASIMQAEANYATASANMGYTKIVSPVDGKIGKIIITEGNLVNTQTGPIARVVSNSPIYVLFNLKSSEFLKFKKQGSSKDFSNMEVRLQLADGTMYDEVGKIEYVGNEVDQTTGTIDLRATFQNENELLVPGDFVSVVIKSIEPREALTVPQSAALNDAQGYYVWTVDADNKTVRKNIQVSQEINKNWIVESGLEITDNIVAKGVQSIRMPGQVVKPTPLETEDKSADETK